MISDQIKNVLAYETKGLVQPKLSRKTILLKKRNKQLTNQSVPNIKTDNEKLFTSPPRKDDRIQQKEQKDKHSEYNKPPSQSQSVSCQTNNSLIFNNETDQSNGMPEVPFTDPIWQEIIPPELLGDQSLEKLLEENKEYFHNLLGLYLQERMQKDFNMSKLNLPGNWQTSYGLQFRQSLDKSKSQHNLDHSIYNDPKRQSLQTFTSTSYQTQFKPYDPSDFNSPLPKRQYEKSPLEMSSLTTYQANFFNFKQLSKPDLIKASRISTNSNLPMVQQTTYSQEFKNHQDCERYENQKNSYSKLNPISSSSMFYQKPQANYQYYPPPPKYQSEPYSPTPSYNGQFKSTFKNDFQPHDTYGLSQKNWRQNLVSKLNQLRQKE